MLKLDHSGAAFGAPGDDCRSTRCCPISGLFLLINIFAIEKIIFIKILDWEL